MSLDVVSSRNPISYPIYEGDKKKPVDADNSSQEPSTAKQFVEWIRTPRPGYQRVFVYTAVAIIAIALFISVAGWSFLGDCAEENRRQEEAERLRLLDQPVIGILGGEAAYAQLPVHAYEDKDASSPYSRPKVRELSSGTMRGTDKFNRPVLFFKIYDKTTCSSFVEMIYRRYSHEGRNNPWINNKGERSIFDGELVMSDRALKRLDDVLHNRSHQFALA